MHREQPVWAEFRHLIHGLLQTQSRLWRALQPEPDETPPEG